jgi:hypothetical protein
MMDELSLEEAIREIRVLKEWIKANTRRLDDFEANAFFLEDHEEVLLIATPRIDREHPT